MKDTIKKTIDFPKDLFERIMAYSHKKKIYKFGPAVIDMLEEVLNKLDNKDK